MSKSVTKIEFTYRHVKDETCGIRRELDRFREQNEETMRQLYRLDPEAGFEVVMIDEEFPTDTRISKRYEVELGIMLQDMRDMGKEYAVLQTVFDEYKANSPEPLSDEDAWVGMAMDLFTGIVRSPRPEYEDGVILEAFYKTLHFKFSIPKSELAKVYKESEVELLVNCPGQNTGFHLKELHWDQLVKYALPMFYLAEGADMKNTGKNMSWNPMICNLSAG